MVSISLDYCVRVCVWGGLVSVNNVYVLSFESIVLFASRLLLIQKNKISSFIND